jgi:hypothetical protein
MVSKLELLLVKTEEAVRAGFDDNDALLDEILDLRTDVIDELIGLTEVSSEHKRLIRSISDLDQVLIAHMESAKNQITASLNKLAQSKLHKQSYEQAYDTGSYFIDKKK